MQSSQKLVTIESDTKNDDRTKIDRHLLKAKKTLMKKGIVGSLVQ